MTILAGYVGVLAACGLALYFLGLPWRVLLRAKDPFGERTMLLGLCVLVGVTWQWADLTGRGLTLQAGDDYSEWYGQWILTLRDAGDLLHKVESAAPSSTVTGGSEGGQPAEAILPVMLSASDIAKRIKRNPKSVTSFLTRFAEKYPDCRVENNSKRKNEPGYLYRTADVWPALEQWMKDNPPG